MDIGMVLRSRAAAIRAGVLRQRHRAAVLPELTADDLKDLGVALVGHRRKLLAAIAALRSDLFGPAPGDIRVAPSAKSLQKVRVFELVSETDQATGHP